MSVTEPEIESQQYTVMHRAPHSLHECRDAEDFRSRFTAATGFSVEGVVAGVVKSDAAKAVLLVGSLPLGMATGGSDIDLVVLVNGREDLIEQKRVSANTQRDLFFSNENDALRAGEFLSVVNGILVDTMVVMVSTIERVYRRLRGRGPDLSEVEILILGRLRTGWLLWESEGYLAQHKLKLTDTALDVYCSTRSYVSALHLLQKGRKALELGDIPLTLDLGRSAVRDTYLSYFASEGFCYLGPKWLAQLGHARGAQARLERHPQLKQGLPLLFPALTVRSLEASLYLEAVAELVTSLRRVIEQKTLFGIAFEMCPQIHAV